ncbi:hypothetical protein GCM10022393_18990 [Aquimarina addita]|uniref:DKNYY family protein n=1 Tax=Aquimarina addita TaxID=870485 RepID=A0ABP6UHS0_9FLAO
MKKYIFIAILFLCFKPFTTGPSSISSKIRPISIHENGDILCRTRFTKNDMGSHSYTEIEYGYCIISKGKMIPYISKRINPHSMDYDRAIKNIKYWDALFESCYAPENLCKVGRMIQSKYNFTSCNAQAYRVDKIMSISEFEKKTNIQLHKTSQTALKGASSTTYYPEKKVHVLFDFGKVFIFKNTVSYDDSDETLYVGANFDYFNPWQNENGVLENIGYDISTINGVLIKD